jgi:DNA sulfur modification protein DndB
MESIKTRASLFEQEIMAFMQKLDFKDVDGGRDNFKINNVQVDVFGGHEKTLIIGECHMRQQLGKHSIREKIKNLSGTRTLLERGFKEHPAYKNYRDFRYIIVTKNIDIRKEDIDFANSMIPRIYIWDDNFIQYYFKLYKTINKYAKFNLLGEMRIRPETDSPVCVPAFQIEVGKAQMFTFLINPHDLLEVAYVARRETRNERYYQRIINKDKLNKIAKYVNSNNLLPNNLIIAFGEHVSRYVKFIPENKNYFGGRFTSGLGVNYGALEFPRDYRSCWIIDGQHRLYAFGQTQQFLNVPVTAFKNLDIEKQCKYFLDINKNQKPVPADLVWDLNGDMIPSEDDGIISNTVKCLNEYGPLRYRIYIPAKGIKQKSSYLKMAGICLSLKNAGLVKRITISKTENTLYSDVPKKMINNLTNALNKYWSCVQKLLNEDWMLEGKGFVLDDGGNSIMVHLFEKILSRCVYKGIPSDEDYIKYLTPVATLFRTEYKDKEQLSKLKKDTTSDTKRGQLLKRLVILIKLQLDDEKFGGNIELPAQKMIRDLEGRLKELLNDILLENAGNNWFEERVPPSVRGKALSNMRKHGLSDTGKAYQQLVFGECIDLMRQNRELFFPLYRHEECGFGSDAEIEGAFNHLSRFRTPKSHSLDLKSKSHDNDLFEIYVNKINQCIDAFYELRKQVGA